MMLRFLLLPFVMLVMGASYTRENFPQADYLKAFPDAVWQHYQSVNPTWQLPPPPPPPAITYDFSSTTGSGVREDPANTFAIPRCGSGKLGYVTTRWTPPLTGTAMWIDYTITGTADAKIMGYQERYSQGRMHLHFQRQGDDWYSTKYNAGYRQWSTAYKLLTLGDFHFEVPLTLDKWGNRTGWATAMRYVENAGFTLGDVQTKGHGVCMAAGSAKLTIRAFGVK